jgi:predicted secreted Zn-dependent protease
MAKKKGKSVSFDAMVKFFLQYYNIPSRNDIDKLMAKMDHLEMLIKSSSMTGKGDATSGVKASKTRESTSRTAMTSTDRTLEVIKRFRKGVGFADIQERTGFEEKKLRNIIYRLHKIGKIIRKTRGLYIAA